MDPEKNWSMNPNYCEILRMLFTDPQRHQNTLQLATRRRQRSSCHGSYYSAEFIFPDFPGQNESFSLTNLFMRNTSVSFQLLAITLETRPVERILNCRYR